MSLAPVRPTRGVRASPALVFYFGRIRATLAPVTEDNPHRSVLLPPDQLIAPVVASTLPCAPSRCPLGSMRGGRISFLRKALA
jgi:hypothetical protein